MVLRPIDLRSNEPNTNCPYTCPPYNTYSPPYVGYDRCEGDVFREKRWASIGLVFCFARVREMLLRATVYRPGSRIGEGVARRRNYWVAELKIGKNNVRYFFRERIRTIVIGGVQTDLSLVDGSPGGGVRIRYFSSFFFGWFSQIDTLMYYAKLESTKLLKFTNS